MVKKALPTDAALVAQVAHQLWPHHALEDFAADYELTLQEQNTAVFLYMVEDVPTGFAHVSLRHDYVEGTSTCPVGFLEGIFVLDLFRGHGMAASLLAACEDWARSRGCTEFASDCELDNEESIAFHGKLGFTEVNRVVCFCKSL